MARRMNVLDIAFYNYYKFDDRKYKLREVLTHNYIYTHVSNLLVIGNNLYIRETG